MNRFLITCLLALLAVTAISFCTGPYGFDFDWELISGIRAPRLVTAAFAGAATATAGALSQSLFRNSLATPSIIGTEAGAAFALALMTLLLTDSGQSLSYPAIYTTAGAAVATALSLSLLQGNGLRKGHLRNDSRGDTSDSISRLLLGGFALNALLAAGTAFCVSILMEKGHGLNLYHWLLGSFTGRTWTHAISLCAGYLLCVILTLRISPSLDALSLGDDSAKSIGINVGRVYLYVLLLIACLTGTALACGGALPFIGLIAPHFARLRSRPHLMSVLPLSAIVGAGITILADLAARTLRAPIDMDVGILTTLIGAPYFLWLLRRGQNA